MQALPRAQNYSGIYGHHSIKVLVFEKDKFKLEIKLAPRGKKKVLHSKGRFNKDGTYRQTAIQDRKTQSTVTKTRAKDGTWKPVATSDSAPGHWATARDSIKLTREGKAP